MALNQMSGVFRGLRNLSCYTRCSILYFQKSNFSFSQVLGKGLNDEPVKYSRTEASQMKSKDIFFPKPNPAVLPVERYVVIASLIAFLIYFCVLREENKLDEILGGSFRYEGDEELKLVNAIIQAKLKKLKTDDLEEKLREIRALK